MRAPLPPLALSLILISAPALTPVPVHAQVRAYRVTVEVETNSDWTTVELDGSYLLNYSYEVMEGLDAPELRVSVKPSRVSVGKRQLDTTLVKVRISGYLVFYSEPAEITIRKGDLEHTSVRIYSETGELVWSFTNEGVVPGSGGVNPRSRILREEAFRGVGGREVILEGRTGPRLVLAFYYPWYGNPEGPSHRWFHWNYPPGVTYREIAASTDYPLLGPYDSWDERVLRSHVAMAKAAGMDGFICSWWGIGTFEDAAFRRVLEVAEEEGFRVTVYYESVREIGRDQVVTELSYVLNRYSQSPAFLRIDGKPAVFIYAVEAKGRDLTFWSEVARLVEERTGVEAVYIGDTYNLSFLSAFEGLHTYNPIWIDDHAGVYADMAERVKRYLPPEALRAGRAVRRLWCAGVVPGYDDRKIRRPGNHVPRGGGEYYKRTWRAAIASGADLVTLCSWNEWHEGTEVEPSREYGFYYLRLTRAYAGLYKNASLPEAPAPRVVALVNGSESGAALVLRNEGPSPAVITALTVRYRGSVTASSPPGGYLLDLNGTAKAVFVPYIGVGEEVEVLRAVGDSEILGVEGTSWSPTGASADVTLHVPPTTPPSTTPPTTTPPPTTAAPAGPNWGLIGGAVIMVIAAAALILAARKSAG